MNFLIEIIIMKKNIFKFSEIIKNTIPFTIYMVNNNISYCMNNNKKNLIDPNCIYRNNNNIHYNQIQLNYNNFYPNNFLFNFNNINKFKINEKKEKTNIENNNKDKDKDIEKKIDEDIIKSEKICTLIKPNIFNGDIDEDKEKDNDNEKNNVNEKNSNKINNINYNFITINLGKDVKSKKTLGRKRKSDEQVAESKHSRYSDDNIRTKIIVDCKRYIVDYLNNLIIKDNSELNYLKKTVNSLKLNNIDKQLKENVNKYNDFKNKVNKLNSITNKDLRELKNDFLMLKEIPADDLSGIKNVEDYFYSLNCNNEVRFHYIRNIFNCTNLAYFKYYLDKSILEFFNIGHDRLISNGDITKKAIEKNNHIISLLQFCSDINSNEINNFFDIKFIDFYKNDFLQFYDNIYKLLKNNRDYNILKDNVDDIKIDIIKNYIELNEKNFNNEYVEKLYDYSKNNFLEYYINNNNTRKPKKK